jgi:hypothetical protein
MGIQDYVRTEPIRDAYEYLDAATQAELDAIECKLIDRRTRYEHLTFLGPGTQSTNRDNVLTKKAIAALCDTFWPRWQQTEQSS